MKKKFSTKWKSSKQPRKQRKYRYNAPLHIKQKFIRAIFSKELRAKHQKRNFNLKKGDRVRVLRGQFRKHEGKIERINLPYCSICGVELRSANQKFCEQCGSKIILIKEEKVEKTENITTAPSQLKPYSRPGGLFDLIQIESSGIIQRIEPNYDVSIITDQNIFGFGPIDVIVTVESENTDMITMNIQGSIFGPFVFF